MAAVKRFPKTDRPDPADMQGLLVSGYGHLTCAAYLLAGVNAGATDGARRWLGETVDRLTTAESKQEGWSLNVALTFHGLAALGLTDAPLATFPSVFRDGMASPARARILGDQGASAPETWQWGGPSSAPIDVLVLLYATDPERLSTLVAEQRARLGPALTEIVTLEAGRQPDSREHFGFADGIAQPRIAGLGRGRGATEAIKAGEFVLGYQNHYGQPSEVPTVSRDLDRANSLPTLRPEQVRGLSNVSPDDHDLGRNGSYLVFRQLAQDVAGLWRYVDEVTRDASGASDPTAQTRLAAKMVGRWPSGVPLVKAPRADPLAGRAGGEGLSKDNAFDYAAADPHGFACPVGSHIRRAFPRNGLVSASTHADKALISANRHRLLRRGRSYGNRLTNPRVDDGAERGLHFLCLNADLERQFEFVQQTWINNPIFGGLDGEVDPLIGDTARSSGRMTIPGDPLRTRVDQLPSFVTVKGGAYFFLPGVRALRFLSHPQAY